MIPDEVRRALDDYLTLRPNATRQQVEAFLAPVIERYNNRPQDDLLGLSPAQMQALVYDRWEGEGAVRLDASLSLADLDASRTLHNARTVMAYLAEKGPLRMTTAGNLSRAAVADLFVKLRWHGEKDPETFRRFVRNERDAWVLHLARVLLDLAGVVKRQKGMISMTRRGTALLAETRAGELFALLFRAQFQRMSLAYVSPYTFDSPEFQRMVSFALYAYAAAPAGWETPAVIADRVLLPFVRDSLPTHQYPDSPVDIVRTHLLHTLEGFGVVEEQEREIRPGHPIPPHLFRRTPLFERFISFHL